MSRYLNIHNAVCGKPEEEQRKAAKKAMWDLAFQRNVVSYIRLQSYNIFNVF